MPSFKRHDVDGMKSLWAYMVKDYSILHIEGASRRVPRVIGWYVRCMYIGQSGTLCAMWYVVFYKKKLATTISHLNLPHIHIRISFNKFIMAKCAIIWRAALRGTGMLVYVSGFASLEIAQSSGMLTGPLCGLCDIVLSRGRIIAALEAINYNIFSYFLLRN